MKITRAEEPADSRPGPSAARRLIDDLLRRPSPDPAAEDPARLATRVNPIAAPAW
ncbi:hypothetical protein AB0J83_35755 [Actinoplanes sp. NPDC049596]|uniref:hypothetical protein n=1 Tax=unclassified Actinoplanes TaxID=2626549 RepID=UPI00342F0A64